MSNDNTLPYHNDLCNHENDHPGSYKGSFTIEHDKYDVYLYPNRHDKGNDLCVRYGVSREEYLSIGKVQYVIDAVLFHGRNDMIVYANALDIIKEYL
jgi:hypothetical protein